MFILELFDRNGKSFDFYAEVKYLPEEQIITPFHTFSFHSVVKVDEVPEWATKASEDRYNVWYLPSRDQFDTDPEAGEMYLQSWRACEYKLNQKMFRIKIQEQ